MSMCIADVTRQEVSVCRQKCKHLRYLIRIKKNKNNAAY